MPFWKHASVSASQQFFLDLGAANDKYILAPISKKYNKMSQETQKDTIRTVLKAAMIATACGIITGLLTGPVAGVVIAAVVGIEAFAYISHKQVSDKKDISTNFYLDTAVNYIHRKLHN